MSAPTRIAPATDFDKALEAAERIGLRDYDVVKEGRKVTIKVRHSAPSSEDLDLEEQMKRAASS